MRLRVKKGESVGGMSDKKRPWMKWYPADWRADPKLRMCSLAARGLWADLIALMHEAEPYGHLLINGRAPSSAQLANIVGCGSKEIDRLLAELTDADVCSRTEVGTIYSRRMVRDREKEDRDRINGKGGGNPKISAPVIRGVNPYPIPPDNWGDKAQMPEARGHKPETREEAAAPLSLPREPRTEAAARLIAEFDKARIEVFGAEHHRNWPHPLDLTEAQRWLEAGAEEPHCASVFRAVFQRQKATGKRPAASLSYMRNAIAEAAQAPPVAANLSPQARNDDLMARVRAAIGD